MADSVMKVIVLLPTYNEAENIADIVKAIRRLGYSVLVIDDNSPDGTADIAKKSGAEVIIRKEKSGLGAAYKDGFMAVLQRFSDVVVHMDADGQHDPREISVMLTKINEGADVVIGSRYLKGGVISDDWGVHRLLMSRLAQIVARLSGVKGVSDCTSGFRAVKTSLLKRTYFLDIKNEGYAFLVSMLKAFQSAGAVIKEVPIVFSARNKGSSKMSWKEAIQGLRILWG